MAADTIQILHIEDNPLEAALMRELVSVSLPDKHELAAVTTMAEALDHLANHEVDLILADLSLPDASGMKTIHSLLPAAPGIPIIILSGYDDEKTSLDALRAGASDYLVKGEVSSHLLRHAIRYAIERKRLDTALSVERDLVDNLLENTPDRIYFKDLNSRFLRINRTMASLIGVDDPVDAVGRSDRDFFSAEYAAAAHESEQTVISTGQPLVGHIEHEQMPDGQEYWVLTSKMPLISATGEIVGTFGISRDITEIKDAEQKLEYALSRNRLLADNLKQLASLTADEVESSLPDINSENAKGFDQLRLAAERLRKISQLDQQTELHQNVPLAELFNEAVDRLNGSADELQLVFRPERFPSITGNRELLAQLAVEILRITERGRGDLPLTVTAHEAGDYWQFTVSTAGANTLPADAFRVVDDAQRAVGAGANVLAISLCKRIVELHGGLLLTGSGSDGAPAIRFSVPLDETRD